MKMAIYSGQNMFLFGAKITIKISVLQTELFIVCVL